MWSSSFKYLDVSIVSGQVEDGLLRGRPVFGVDVVESGNDETEDHAGLVQSV